MKKFNKKKFLSLVLALTMVFGAKHGIDMFFRKHPEYFYNLKYSTHTYVLQDDDNYECLEMLPELNTMVPQGIALGGEYTYVSMYDYLKLKKSIICVLDKDCKLVNKVSLDCFSHVGGISYDEVNNLLWVSGTNGSVRAYDVCDFLDKNEVRAIYVNEDVGKDLINYRGQQAVSYLTVLDNKLYVGNFRLCTNGIMKIYDIKYDDGIDLEYSSKIDVPSKVQGVTFYKDGDNKYILFARSYGTKNDSVIQVYKYSEDMDCNKDKYFTLMVDPMLEQIQIDSNGNLYSIYESNAAIYCDGNKDDDFKVIDFNRLVKK